MSDESVVALASNESADEVSESERASINIQRHLIQAQSSVLELRGHDFVRCRRRIQCIRRSTLRSRAAVNLCLLQPNLSNNTRAVFKHSFPSRPQAKVLAIFLLSCVESA